MKHLVQLQFVLIIIVFLISLISGINDNSTAMMITLLVFVGSEFIVLSIGYLEQIMNVLKSFDSSKYSDVRVIINKPLEWIDYAAIAKNDIFLSGPTLGSLVNYRRSLLNIPPNVKVRMLVHDYNNFETIAAYCKVCKPNSTPQKLKDKNKMFLNLIDEFEGTNNIEIRVTDVPLHIIYIGCDIYNSSEVSAIRAQHFLRKYKIPVDVMDIDDKLIFETQYSSSLYEIYENQIKALWDTAIPYKKDTLV